MPPSEITSLLDFAEDGLNSVSESMLRAELPLLEQSRLVLGQIFDSLTRVNRSLSSAIECPRDTRSRLEKIHFKLLRLQLMGDAAAFMLRSRSRADASSGYTTSGVAERLTDFRTLSLEY